MQPGWAHLYRTAHAGLFIHIELLPDAASALTALRRGSQLAAHFRVRPRPRSHRPRECWSRGSPQIPGRAAGLAVTAPGRAWVTRWARSWVGVLIAAGGYPLLFTTLAVLGVAVAGWALAVVPDVPPLPRARGVPRVGVHIHS